MVWGLATIAICQDAVQFVRSYFMRTNLTRRIHENPSYPLMMLSAAFRLNCSRVTIRAILIAKRKWRFRQLFHMKLLDEAPNEHNATSRTKCLMMYLEI